MWLDTCGAELRRAGIDPLEGFSFNRGENLSHVATRPRSSSQAVPQSGVKLPLSWSEVVI